MLYSFSVLGGTSVENRDLARGCTRRSAGTILFIELRGSFYHQLACFLQRCGACRAVRHVNYQSRVGLQLSDAFYLPFLLVSNALGGLGVLRARRAGPYRDRDRRRSCNL